MSIKDDERDFRLRPERQPKLRDDSRAWSNAFKRIIHFARITSKRKTSHQSGAVARPYNQRCAVRVTYSPNKVAGQWAAHGRYISRESAAAQESPQRGFASTGSSVDIAATLAEWQNTGDPRLFKLIVSPEFGDRIDLENHTRCLMERMERDLGTKLEWLAVVHRNTEHPHVHVALRGIDHNGAELRLSREFIKNGIRQHAEQLATEQLGYRTQLDAEEAQRREIHQARYTSLDRAIRSADQTRMDAPTFDLCISAQSVYVKKRLLVLQEMGLAEQVGSKNWRVRTNFAQILREMQKSTDRQKALAAHRALVSDPRLPFQVTDLRRVDSLTGRILGHGEEESTGRTYMLLEGDDKKIHFVYHNRSIEQHRHEGRFKPDSRVTLSRNGSRLERSESNDRAESRSSERSNRRSR